MKKSVPQPRDVEHRPFGVLLASKPPSQAGRTGSSLVSLAIHVAMGSGLVWATMAMAGEVTDEPEEVYVELVAETFVPPPPPPPPPPEIDLPPPPAELRGFQTLQIPTVVLPDIPPPATTFEFNAADFSGEGVTGGRADGREATAADTLMPSFTPMTVRPRITNTDEVARAMEREYPPLLRDAGIGGVVTLSVYIDAEGTPVRWMITPASPSMPNGGSSGHDALDQAALQVADVIEFTPAWNRDQKVPVWVTFPIRFQIS